MTVIFTPGAEPPEGPFVPGQGTPVGDVLPPEAAGDVLPPMRDYAPALRAMTAAAEGSVREGADPEGVLADLAARSAMHIAGAMLMETADDLIAIRRRLREEEDAGSLDKAVKLARDLRAGAQLMIEERNRLDKLRKDAAGGVAGAGSLDLAAARDEIGRRLACLRRAGGGG